MSRSSAQQGEAEGWTIRSTTHFQKIPTFRFGDSKYTRLQKSCCRCCFFFFKIGFSRWEASAWDSRAKWTRIFPVSPRSLILCFHSCSRPFVWPARSFSTFAQIRALLQSKKYTEVINIVLKMAFKSLKFQGFFIVESALGLYLSSWFTGPALKYLETNNSNTNITGLKTQLAGGNQLAIYKRGREFELGTTENKSSKWPE